MSQVSKEHYNKYDSYYRFATYWAQIEEVKDIKSILEIGCGNKTVANYLIDKGYDVTTVDFAVDLEPDILADIRNLDLKQKYDCVLCCEVLEHLPLKDLDKALGRIQLHTATYAIISVPNYCAKIAFTIQIMNFLKTIRFNIPAFFTKPKFTGEHYWGLGQWGISKREFRKRLRKAGFKIIKEKYPSIFNGCYFFVCEVS